MNIEMHSSVQKVAEFMQRELPADELRGVADALAVVAPAIWGNYPIKEITPLTLRVDQVANPCFARNMANQANLGNSLIPFKISE